MNAISRSNQEWVQALSGYMGDAAQQAAHHDLATHLFKSAYSYLLRRQANLPPLAGFAHEEVVELAQDFVQETLERMAQNSYFLLTKYSNKGRFEGWMTQIIHNQIASELRRPYWSRRNWIPADVELETDDGRANGPEQEAILAHINLVLSACLQKLSKRYRTALLRCIVEDERAEVVAAELGISANAVYLLVHRAKQNLRKCVIKSGVDSDVFGIF